MKSCKSIIIRVTDSGVADVFQHVTVLSYRLTKWFYELTQKTLYYPRLYKIYTAHNCKTVTFDIFDKMELIPGRVIKWQILPINLLKSVRLFQKIRKNTKLFCHIGNCNRITVTLRLYMSLIMQQQRNFYQNFFLTMHLICDMNCTKFQPQISTFEFLVIF